MPLTTKLWPTAFVFFVFLICATPCHTEISRPPLPPLAVYSAQLPHFAHIVHSDTLKARVTFKAVLEDHERGMGYKEELSDFDAKIVQAIDVCLMVLFTIIGASFIVIAFSFCFIFGASFLA